MGERLSQRQTLHLLMICSLNSDVAQLAMLAVHVRV